MDRITRHELKSDQFVEQVGQIVENVEAHRSQFIRYGIAAIAVIMVGAGIYWFLHHRKEVREADLGAVMRTWTAPVGGAPAEYSFATAESKEKAIAKVLSEFVAKHSGSKEAGVGDYLLGIRAADQGKFDDAERYFKLAVDDAGKEYGSLAKLALADIYSAKGKSAEAEKLLKDLMDHPTVMVSKDQALISLARLYSKTKPAEARKLIDPLLRSPDTSAGRIATALMTEASSTSK
ncbi:MAG: tetratricopeptide repeat protein [Bryobacteraceae bacterium]